MNQAPIRTGSPVPTTTEAEGATVALANFSDARRAMLRLLKTRGEASADELASAVGVTVSAVRQQVVGLESDGLVAHREEHRGPGRPRHVYRLTAAAEALFPKRYGELTNQLLGFIDDAGPGLVDLAFERRRQVRAAQAALRMAGKSFDDRVRELAAILDEDGYLADCERLDDGTWRVTEHNCAILDVARRYGNACVSELAFLRDAMPDADVARVAHMIAGAHVCAYELRRRDGSTSS